MSSSETLGWGFKQWSNKMKLYVAIWYLYSWKNVALQLTKVRNWEEILTNWEWSNNNWFKKWKVASWSHATHRWFRCSKDHNAQIHYWEWNFVPNCSYACQDYCKYYRIGRVSEGNHTHYQRNVWKNCGEGFIGSFFHWCTTTTNWPKDEPCLVLGDY